MSYLDENVPIKIKSNGSVLIDLFLLVPPVPTVHDDQLLLNRKKPAQLRSFSPLPNRLCGRHKDALKWWYLHMASIKNLRLKMCNRLTIKVEIFQILIFLLGLHIYKMETKSYPTRNELPPQPKEDDYQLPNSSWKNNFLGISATRVP